MDFPKALVRVYEAHSDFWRSPHDNVADFCELERNVNAYPSQTLGSWGLELGYALVCEDLLRALRRQLIQAARGIVEVLTRGPFLPQLFDETFASGSGTLTTDARSGKHLEYKPPCFVESIDATHTVSTCRSWLAKPVANEDVSEINAFFDSVDSCLWGSSTPNLPAEVRHAAAEVEPEVPKQFEDLDAFLDHCLAEPDKSKPLVAEV